MENLSFSTVEFLSPLPCHLASGKYHLSRRKSKHFWSVTQSDLRQETHIYSKHKPQTKPWNVRPWKISLARSLLLIKQHLFILGWRLASRSQLTNSPWTKWPKLPKLAIWNRKNMEKHPPKIIEKSWILPWWCLWCDHFPTNEKLYSRHVCGSRANRKFGKLRLGFCYSMAKADN